MRFAEAARRSLREPGNAVSSIRLNVVLRVRRVPTQGLALCSGRPPVLFRGGSVRFGDGVVFRNIVVRAEVGAERGGRLVVGDRTFINEGASVVALHHISVGADCLIGEYAAVFDSDHHDLEPGRPRRMAPVRLDDNVWLGRGALVLPGVTIGRDSVVAAGSVVTRDVPTRTLVAGNPARVVRELQITEGWRRR